MRIRDYAVGMAAYNSWMNEKIFGCAAELSDNERKRDQGAFFRSIHGTLNHILLADESWLQRFRGQPVTMVSPAQEVHADFEDLRAARRAMDGEIAMWAVALTDEDMPDLHDCIDLDFGFTPSTNLLQLRRLALECGQAADAPAAWVDVETGTLDILVQRYERRSETTYWYQAPRFNYADILEVDHIGFVRRYPGLWEVEA
jgi:uncharacterized damage-inducible protein DinB